VLALSLVQKLDLGPILMFLLAVLFLRNLPRLHGRLIHDRPGRDCIAMVIVWCELAPPADNEYSAGLVAFNAIFQMIFYSDFAYIFTYGGCRRCSD